MLLHTVRFLCSVAAAFARLVRDLRKAAAMASPVGLIASTPLPPLRRKPRVVVAVPEKLMLVTPAPPPPAVVVPHPLHHADVTCNDVTSGVGRMVVEQQGESKRKKTAWSAKGRPSRLVIPVVGDAGRAPAGWAAAAVEEVDVEVKGEGFWLASRAGPRHAMEDAYAVATHGNGGDSQLVFYGVFDGHGGRSAVDFVSQRLGKNVVSAVLANEASSAAEDDAVSAAIRAAYLATDSELLAQHQQGASGGACAATAVVKGGELYVAHLGDCRAVLSHGGAATALTADHTCEAEEERARIERDGGYVCGSGSGVWRLQGSLAVSRAFGDAAFKQWVLAEPEVARVPLDAGCEFLVVASDGLWDKVSNQEAVDAVSRSRATACRELVDMARRRGSRDDVTVMVVDLERFVR